MSRILVVAFSPPDCASGAAFAAALGFPHDVVAVSSGVADSSAEKIFECSLNDLPLAEDFAPLIAKIGLGYSHIVAMSSMASKDLMARVAGLMDAGMITDVVRVVNATTFIRPVVAGAALAELEALELPVVLTIRASAFPLVTSASGTPLRESCEVPHASATSRTKAPQAGVTRPDLTQAKVVVSGGQPLKDAATFEKVIGGLADKLGGAVGATRAAVDTGIAPNDLQVGQTGKIVAPDLYIACGISGSTQHMAGIKDSKVIVAINTDPSAPIFDVADFGLVADLYQAVPELTSKL